VLIKPKQRATIFPEFEHIAGLSEYFRKIEKNLTFTELLEVMTHSETSNLYQLKDVTDRIQISKLIEFFEMELKDRYMFCMAPIDIDNSVVVKYFREYAFQFSHQEEVFFKPHKKNEKEFNYFTKHRKS